MSKLVDRVMVLGGAGLVGFQIARQISRELKPKLVVLVSLHENEVREAMNSLRNEFPSVTFDGAWGDIFVRTTYSEDARSQMMTNDASIRDLFDDVFGDKAQSFKKSMLVKLVHQSKPDVIIDAINTATAISYQDVYLSSLEIGSYFKEHKIEPDAKSITIPIELARKIKGLIVSQSIPQLIRHVQLLHDAMVKAGTRLYLKIGTTGTGGMGLNIPYTHSEDKPSANLMSKTAVGFAHTGLLFLMARTPKSPIVKEIKPAALIGYRKVDYRIIQRAGKPVHLYHAQKLALKESLNIAVAPEKYQKIGPLTMVGVDTGENGFFTLGEFSAITTMYQMEFVTPEEIAQNVVLEISGCNTGKDVIAAIDSAVMDPSYRAGILRAPVQEELKLLEEKTNTHSVALGQLGPPELSKLLYEAHLLAMKYKTLAKVIATDAAEISQVLENHVLHNPIRHTIVSIGVPILLGDGKTLIRGPKINIPEYRGEYELKASKANLDRWAKKGWIDLRVANMIEWQKRFKIMAQSRTGFVDEGSSSVGLATYFSHEIEIGEVVGWIFNNDPEIAGYRMKAL